MTLSNRFRIVPALLVVLMLLGVNLPTRADLNKETFSSYSELLERYLIEASLPGDALVSAFDYPAAVNDEAVNLLLSDQHERLATFDLDRLDSRERAVAFWNNAYNYFMLAEILLERPGGELVGSVWDYGGRYNPFRDSVFTREKYVIGGQTFSLNTMEKGILLGDDFAERGWKDARVHFTVNCASVGCPPLRIEIYTEHNIDALLADNTRLALNTERHLRVDGGTLFLTRLFDWYEDDFVEEAGSIRQFIDKHADQQAAQQAKATSQIQFIEYDWQLNRPDNFPELQ